MKLDIIAKNSEEKDEFYTPEYAIQPLLKYLTPKSRIWCPFDTKESNFVKMLKKEGHKVLHSHIGEFDNLSDRNRLDFFKLVELHGETGFDYIISNPPYSKKTEVLEALFKCKTPFAMLLGVVGIFESKKRYSLFKENEFEIMYFNKRIAYFKDFAEQKPSLNPPFSSVYITRNVLPEKIIFEEIQKKLKKEVDYEKKQKYSN